MSKRQVPLHPGASGAAGSGDTGPAAAPAVCVHAVGPPAVKSTLWMDTPAG